MLKNENIRYKVLPVTGHQDLEGKLESLKSSNNLASIITINCGGYVDLPSKWFLQEDQKVKVVVMDSHRPIHHSNLNCNNKKLVIIDDESFDKNSVPTELEVEQAKQYNPQEGSNKKVDQSDEELSEDDFDHKMKKIQAKDEDDEYVFGDGSNAKSNPRINNEEDDDEIDIELGKKRALRRVEKVNFQKAKLEEAKNKVDEYYRGSYYGKSVAGLIYCLFTQLSVQDSNRYLWYWILGVTDMHINNKISEQQYLTSVNECGKEVHRLNPDTKNTLMDNMTYQSENDNTQYMRTQVKTTRMEVGKICQQEDLNLFLLRHWNLYDSLFYSKLIISKLKTWVQDGDKNLLKLIAHLGMP